MIVMMSDAVDLSKMAVKNVKKFKELNNLEAEE